MEGTHIFLTWIRGFHSRPFLLPAVVILCLSFTSPDITYSWDLAKEQNDITVYTRKVVGSRFKEYRAVTKIKATLSSLVALVDDMEACPLWIHTCKKGKLLKRISGMKTYAYTISNAPWPVSDRDAAVCKIISQNPEDRVVTIMIKGVPRYIPERPGLVRVKKIEGYWRFTPLDNDIIEVVYLVHSEPGGSLPSWLVNSVVVDQPYYTLVNMKEAVKRPNYQEARYEFIKE